MDTIDKINFYLSKIGKNGADMSRALGLSNSIYSQWNTRKSKPSKNRLPAIAEYLGVTVSDLLPDCAVIPEEGAKKAPTEISERDDLCPTAERIVDILKVAPQAELDKILGYVEFLQSKWGEKK